MTRWPPAARRRATTNPSPPLFPVPHSTTLSSRSASGPPGPDHRLGEAGQLGERDLGHRGAGALHQGVLAQAELLGRLIDLGHLGRADQHGPSAGLARRRGCGRAGARIGHSSVSRKSTMVAISSVVSWPSGPPNTGIPPRSRPATSGPVPSIHRLAHVSGKSSPSCWRFSLFGPWATPCRLGNDALARQVLAVARLAAGLLDERARVPPGTSEGRRTRWRRFARWAVRRMAAARRTAAPLGGAARSVRVRPGRGWCPPGSRPAR